jgi:ATP-dependent Clp protease adaptor protein ClpS
MAEKWGSDEGVVTETRRETRDKTRPPRMYRVMLHNDDYTTREFVVDVLRNVFHRSEADAVAIMLNVHNNGVGVAGVYTLEIAETKTKIVESMARRQGYPLRLSIEPED